VQGELLHVEESLWVLTRPTGVAVYDFDFGRYFACRHPWQRPKPITAVARSGAFEDYETTYRSLADGGVNLVHSPQEHLLASELPQWYPLIEDLTLKSVWFDRVPSAAEVASALTWPVFVKGQRQTNRHRRSLSIIDGPEAVERAMEVYGSDPVLAWQKIVCRQFVPLRLVEDPLPERVPSAFEFRSFWWKRSLVGFGRYWWEGRHYSPSPEE
jgi:hypothetical protein